MPINLPSDCDREAACKLQAQLTKSADPGVQIDASGVKTIGQSMLQVLLAAKLSDPGTVVLNPSSPMRDATCQLGMEATLFGEEQS